MQLQQASRKKSKIKLCLQAPVGAGKTKSSLFIAYGLCHDWTKVAVIDTEKSAELYSDLGSYFVLPLSPPFTPERYIEALKLCTAQGMQVIIIDSLTHEWEYLLDVHSTMQGNSYTNWARITPRHNAFVNAIIQADVHIIGTVRSKQDYVLSEKNGKMVPEKVGMKGQQREGLDYEFTLVLELDMTLHAKATKDRTQLFFKKPDFIPSPETGKLILEWCEKGTEGLLLSSVPTVRNLIAECKDVTALTDLYNKCNPACRTELLSEFTKRRQEVTPPKQVLLSHPLKQSNNGSLTGPPNKSPNGHWRYNP